MKHDIGAAKFVQIAQTLEAEIKTGNIGRGDRLSSESALMQRFSVSRNTIRRSLETLSAKNLITKRSGIGSFVTYGGEMIDSEHGWTLALSEGSGKVGTRVLGIWRGLCSDIQDPRLNGVDCLHIDRLRFRSGTGLGISLERSRLPWRDGYGDIPQNGLVDGSLSTTLAGLGILTQSGEEWANVLPELSPDDAQLMGRRAGEAMLRMRRLTRSPDGLLVEYVESLLDPEYFGLHLEF